MASLVIAALLAGSIGAAPAEAPPLAAARASKEKVIAELFAAAGVRYPAHDVLVRVFKREAQLELWAADAGKPLVKVVGYPVCANSGTLGPKRRRGDLQVPEGVYRVTLFNPYCTYHVGMLIDYPNASDRVLGYKPDLGGEIMVHGECVTIGCIPIENDPIEVVYVIAYDAHRAGRPVDVHIFPARMDEPGMTFLREQAGDDASLRAFWENLAPVYAAFESSHRLPRVDVDPKNGSYRVRAAGP